MGIQVTLDLDKLREKDIDVKVDNHVEPIYDEDDYIIDVYEIDYVNLEWLALTLYGCDDGKSAWVDANHWGRNRELLMRWIEKNSLVEGVDWVEG